MQDNKNEFGLSFLSLIRRLLFFTFLVISEDNKSNPDLLRSHLLPLLFLTICKKNKAIRCVQFRCCSREYFLENSFILHEATVLGCLFYVLYI